MMRLGLGRRFRKIKIQLELILHTFTEVENEIGTLGQIGAGDI